LEDRIEMSSYITTYKGVKLYLVTYEEFVNLYVQGKAKNGYIIKDKQNALIVDGKVIGNTFDGHRKLAPIQVPKDWKEFFGYKKVDVITERPTVEAMATEGSRRLKAVLDEAPVAKASAEAKLNELVAEGNKAVEKVVAEGEIIRSAAAADLLVKRKRTSPSPRKKTSV
jgi:hypothetical protein